MLLVLYGVKLKIEVCLLQNYKNLYRLKVIEGLQWVCVGTSLLKY